MSSSASRSGRAAADLSEPRALRTRERILAAIREAAVDSDLDRLTVSAVCRLAEVHRVTFYGHWSSLSDAVADAFAELVDSLAAVSGTAIAEAGSPERLARLYAAALVDQLAELREHRAVYRALFSENGPHGFESVLRGAMRERAQQAVDALCDSGIDVPGRGGEAAAYLAAGVTASFAHFVHGDGEDLDGTARIIAAQLPSWWPAAGTHPAG
ncbi:transcriptional regulator, TetR family [Prauserella aidingensis]|uniref:TetR/AcrR family transcriptional regulator n=1 Tax=Prauserella aidingensis TaxID=387890 RepID=UPI0020A3F0EB|nr:TetR/AcrR family transcriptional regulator [Prauserella aidingensis]MCP2253090.1 transcriptional regulator, TetR family [Prauserella aidingensis]